MNNVDENELRALFEEIEAPQGLDRWRERIADVHAEHVEPPQDESAEDADDDQEGNVVALPVDLRPRRKRAWGTVAAGVAVIVGLGGVVVTTQLLSDTPPADPTMIIDGPDKPVSSPPTPPTRQPMNPSGGTTPQSPDSTQGQPNTPPNGGTEEPVGNDGHSATNEEPTGTRPAWPAMVGDPTAANTGVPLGASLGDHYGDLRVITAGQVISDVRVSGTIIVDAPNVTLLRVLVIAPSGAPAVRQNGGNLTVENSELSGGTSITQSAAGLVVRRSRLESGVTIISGAQLYDSYLNTADVLIPSNSTSVLLRHNVMGRVTMNDLNGAIRGVTIENGLLTQVDAPTGAGSASIHVLGNRFRGNAPSTGWKASAPDYQWAGNTYADSGAPANP